MGDTYAKMPDGTYLKFPDGTDPAVVDRAAKQYLSSKQTATPAPTQNYSGNLSSGSNAPSSFRSDLLAPAVPDRQAIDDYRMKFFNTDNPGANIPMQAASDLASNPNDPGVQQRLSAMSPVGQAAIREKAAEIKAENDRTQAYIKAHSGPLTPMQVVGGVMASTTGNPVLTEGYEAQKNIPGFNPSAAFKGPEGARQGKMVGHGALDPSLNVLADVASFAATPEGAAFGEAMGVIGSLGATAAKIATGAAIAVGEADAASRLKAGDKQGAATSALLGLLPIGIHGVAAKIGDIAARAETRSFANAMDARETTPTGQFAPGTPYQIPEINRPVAQPPVVPEPTAPPPVVPTQNHIAPYLTDTPGYFKDIADRAGLPHDDAAIQLIRMELAGQNVMRVPSPDGSPGAFYMKRPGFVENNVIRTGIQPSDVSALSQNGFTKAADLYQQAKQADPTLTKQDFAQQLYDFHKQHAQDGGAFNYEGPSGNVPDADIFKAKSADGRTIPYYGFNEKTSKPTIQGEPDVPVSSERVVPSKPVTVDASNPADQVSPTVAVPRKLASVDPPSVDTGGEVAPKPASSPGIKTANDETNVNRSLEGLPDLPDHTWQSNEEIYAQAKARGMDKDALNVADNVLKTGRAMDSHELAANALKQKDIRADRADLRSQIKAATDAGTPTDSLLAEYDGLKDQYDKLTQATKRSGTAQSQAFAIRQFVLDDYSHENIQDRLQMAKPDVPLGPADKALVDTLAEQHDTAQTKLTEAQDKLDTHLSTQDEVASQKAAETAVEGMKTKAQRTGRPASADQLAKLDAEHDEIMRRFLKATSQSNAFVDPKILPIIRDLAKNRVQYGVVKVGDLVDYVHSKVEPGIPGITKREVRDAISGHGYGSPIPVATKFGDLKKQMRLLSDIEDIQNKAPRPTRQKVAVSPEEAALRKQKSEALSENRPPRKPTSYEKKLEGYKKQLSNTIDDLTRRIADKDFTAQGRSKLLLDPLAEQLKAQRDALQKVYDSLDPANQKAPGASKQAERAAQSRLDRLTKQFNDMKAANSKGEYGKPNTPARPDTPEEAAMRANLDAARTERDAMRAGQKEGTASDPLKSYKNQLATQIAEMQAHIDSGLTDRASGPKVKQLDAEAQVLRDQRDQMRENVNRKRAEIDGVIEARKGKSALDKYAIYHRAAILSRISTLAKLGSAALQRGAFTPIEEGAGAIMHAIPGYGKIAKMAPHGTPSLAAEGAAFRSLADVKGNVADSMLKLQTGMNSLDARHGTKGFEADAEPINLFTAPQNAHGAIKTTIQRAAFERSMVQQERFELRQGHDINDPAVRTVMEARAYMKSKEAILMQDNMLSTAWSGMVRGLEVNPRLGKFGKNSAAVLRAALPIVKVPSNFVGEAISHTPGIGLIRPAYEIAMSKGIENLSPEQADIIVSALKKHSVGTALFALGYMNANKMGGFYHQGGNGMNDVKPSEVRINLFGKEMDVPSTFLHSPQMEVMMMGAAFRQAIEQAQNSRSRNPQSPAEEAVHRTATGVADALPFIDTPKRLLQATEGSAQAGKAIGETLGSATIPGFLPDIASQLDRDPQNHMQVRQRPQKGFGDALKTSVGARVLVPESSGRRR